MFGFILSVLFWTFVIFGIIEFLKEFFLPDNNSENYLVIFVKNSEDFIEGIIRDNLFKIKFDNKENIKKIIVIDLGSDDMTYKILEKLENDYYGFVEIFDTYK